MNAPAAIDITTTDWTCFDVTIQDHVAHIQLKRPEAMNTMVRDFWNELPAIVRDIDDNARARCIVISSTGKHFCAGMDLAVFQGGGSTSAAASQDRHINAEAMRYHVKELQNAFSCLDEARMPVIAAIQGGCVGGAVDMTSACDIRYCTSDAFFVIQEINIGMTADVGTFPRLCKLIPEGWVRELAYTGRRLMAHRAREIGLVNEVFDSHEEVVAHALATAREIAGKAPLAVTGSKVMINYARDHTIKDGLDYIAVWQTAMFSGPHMAEAFKAKAERRDGDFVDLAPLRKGM
ncbi:MAG: crotonase/enoyl-CoA hydratase family protein [Alphaproteobacteria bacterium]|nr:crotonase/enoyl-CoA hydratase family protein [Alphaproteobacteria bacterium]MBU1514215.1 crotonase/enoyl-CoA hydratase family protein [Alphaproteobacteria bacterium]MBU2095885.1 crotonase/enoyl-CoA hydratase family protein [Alphaproteobacteria bacterium]MBU2151631.1 crotonase/enoyl-CoA hydratase family protein [Alphaproteobacteria bacterium]MBU2307121.1 crotonase/enoyl-CoA hydratase family protein [Alphaproteobacteria bacterium]